MNATLSSRLILMAKPKVRTRGHRVVRSLVVGGILVCGVSLCLRFQLLRSGEFRDPAYGQKLQKLKQAIRETGDDRPFLFVGSSRVDNGFRAVDAEAILGGSRTVYNFSFAGAGPFLQSTILDRIEASGIHPRAICLEILPSVLDERQTGPMELRWLTPDRLTDRERDNWQRMFGGRIDHWPTPDFNPWKEGRSSLLYRLFPAMLTKSRIQLFEPGGDSRGWNQISVMSQAEPEKLKRFERAQMEHGAGLKELQPHGASCDVIREMIEKDRSIPIRIVLMPESTEFRKLYGIGANDRLLAFVKSLNVPVTDSRDWVPDEMFADGHHLLPEGASIFTNRFTKDILVPWLTENR